MVPKNIFIVKKTLETLNKGPKYASVAIRHQSVWSQDNVIKSPYKSVDIPNCTLYDYVCAITGRGYTYEKAFKLSNTFAANLRIKLKIRDGDVVAVMLPNIPDYPLVNMGILEAGGVITSINPIYTALVTLPESVKTIKNALNIAKLDIPIIVVKTNGNPLPVGTVCFNEISEDLTVDTSVLKKVRRNGSDICFLPYSSGTTGLPKGVELSHKNIISNGEQVNEDKMSLGCKIVTLPKLQPDLYFNTIEKYKTNVLFVAPPLVVTLPESVKTIKNALNIAKLDIPIIVVKTNGNPLPVGTVCFNEISEDLTVDTSVLKKVRRNGSDICFLPYSSGTTGLPKGVELSHKNIISNGEQVNEDKPCSHSSTSTQPP
ncbi:AMP dependent coa ligase, partial [Operophtera brumata]